MLLIKTETVGHVTVTMLQSKFNEFYVAKEGQVLVWEIERATFEQAEIVYQAIVDLAKLAAGL